MTLMPQSRILGFLFWTFVGLSTAGFDYDHFTLYKLILILLAIAAVIFDFLRSGWIKIPLPIVVFLFYGLSLVIFSLHQLDEWSGRVLFNLFVIAISAWAAQKLPMTRINIYSLICISVAAFVYRIGAYFGADGKPLVHDQVFLFAVSAFLLGKQLGGNGSRISYFISIALTLIGQVRSALFAMLCSLAFGKTKTIWFVYAFILILYYILFEYTYELGFYGAASSLTWRIYHWTELLAPYVFLNYYTGEGLGSVWRSSLDLRNFYSTGEAYLDSHSFYIQLLVDSGILGVFFFIFLVAYLHKRANLWGKELAIMFLAYGVFQGGVWQFSLIWILLLTKDCVVINEK